MLMTAPLVGHGAPPEPGVLIFIAKMREEPESDEGSSPDEGVPGKTSGHRGRGRTHEGRSGVHAKRLL